MFGVNVVISYVIEVFFWIRVGEVVRYKVVIVNVFGVDEIKFIF